MSGGKRTSAACAHDGSRAHHAVERVAAVPWNERIAYAPAEIPAVTGVPRTTVDRAIANGELSVIRFGGGDERGRHVVLRDDVILWLRRMRRPARWEAEQDGRRVSKTGARRAAGRVTQ